MASTKPTFEDLRIRSTIGGNRLEALITFSNNYQTLMFGNTDQLGETVDTGISIELRTEIEDSLKARMLDMIMSYTSSLEKDIGEVVGFRLRHATNTTDQKTDRKECLAFCFLVKAEDKTAETASIAILSPLLRQFKAEEVVAKDEKIYCGGEAYKPFTQPPIMATLFGGKEKIPCYKISRDSLIYNLLRLDDGSYLLESSFEDFEASLMS